MAKKRAPNLTDGSIAAIVGLLDGWSGDLTWELLAAKVKSRTGSTYTRQTLYKHERIRNAFVSRKASARRSSDRKSAGSLELVSALDRISRLEAECARLNAENHKLLEQFVVWAYNAHVRGLDFESLNRPLLVVNRDQTSNSAKSGIKSTRSAKR